MRTLAPMLMLATSALFLPTVTAVPLAPLSVTPEQVWTEAGPDGLLTPETEMATVKYAFTVSIPQTAGLGLGVCPFGQVIVYFSVAHQPDYATTVLSPSSQIVRLSPQQTSTSVQTFLSIVTTRHAPSHELGVYEVRAQAAPSGELACLYGASQPASASAAIPNA